MVAKMVAHQERIRPPRPSDESLNRFLLASSLPASTRRRHEAPIYWITDFSDNESARAAGNRGRSRTASMDGMARMVRGLGDDRSTSFRAARVTTKENKTADEMSREGGMAFAWRLAQRMGVPFQEHALAHDDPLWSLIATTTDAPPSPRPSSPAPQ